MSVVIERDGREKWLVRTAPQCLTDILVQVADCENEEETLFAFEIGELLRQTLEGSGCMDGSCLASPIQRAVLARWASILELHAGMIRAVLATPDIHADKNEINELPSR